MVSYFRSKDRRVRNVAALYQLSAVRLKFFLRNCSLSTTARQKLFLISPSKLRKNLKFSVRGRNRCLLTARAGSVFRYFRLSRIMSKDLASAGFLTGVRKSSW